MGLAEYQILEPVQIELLHVYFFLASAFGMIEFHAIFVVTLDARSTSGFFADEALLLESFLVNVLDSFDVDQSIFLLKIAFGDPNCTNIMHPHEVTDRLICWVCCL